MLAPFERLLTIHSSSSKVSFQAHHAEVADLACLNWLAPTYRDPNYFHSIPKTGDHHPDEFRRRLTPAQISATPMRPEADVDVTTDAPDSMKWLQLFADSRTPITEIHAGILPPSAEGTRVPPLATLPPRPSSTTSQTAREVSSELLSSKISFHAGSADLMPYEAQVFRIGNRFGGNVVSWYSVVVIEP
jgi:hypothetical protein